MQFPRGLSLVALATCAVATLGACARGELTLPADAPVEQLTVDASTGWAHVDLSRRLVVPQTDAARSTTWDIGFNATNVVVNGGAAGPGGVTVYCLCENANATSAEILAMTAEAQAGAFERVTLASVPAPTAPGWSSETFATRRWYRYNLAGDNRVSPTFDVYIVRRGADVYKLQVVGYYGPAGETRRITFRYAALEN